MTPLIRLYGSREGWSSSEVVFTGMRDGLIANSQLAGTYIYNQDDDGSVSEAETAPVAVSCPPPTNMHVMTAFGHKQRWFILAPNSTKVPQSFLELVSQHTDGIITPSQFGAAALRNANYQGAIQVVKHGISSSFQAYITENDSKWLHQTDLYESMRRECLSFLHLAESSTDRKGTWPLIEAFVNWKERLYAHLTIVMSHREFDVLLSKFEDAFGSRNTEDFGITLLGRVNLPPHAMGAFYSCFDVIIAPSRSEGFGLVPLEGLACGIPCIITIGHGHMEWCEDAHGQLRPGIIPILPGPMAPALFDGDGMAATVDPDAIQEALDETLRTYIVKRIEAIQNMPAIRDEFSWQNVTKDFCDMIQREFSHD